jgi:hypothetical protein
MRNNENDVGKWCAHALVWCCALVFAGTASAQGSVCKYIDADGNIVFSNLPPEKGQRKISCMDGDEPRPKAPAGKTTPSVAPTPAAPTPQGFPKVDADTQRSRDDMRRRVLSDELATEEKLLAEARATYANGAPVPLAEEQSNADRYRERIARLRQSVQLHERNIEALRKEIGTTK